MTVDPAQDSPRRAPGGGAGPGAPGEAAPQVPVQRMSVDTDDAQTAAEWLDAIFPSTQLRPQKRPRGALLTADVATSAGTTTGRFFMGMDMDGHTPPLPTFASGVVLAGVVRTAVGGWDGQVHAVGVGTPWVWMDGADLDARWGPGSQTSILQIPWDLLALAAESTTGLAGGDLHILDTTPVDPAAGHYWAQLVAFTYRGMRTSDPSGNVPLGSPLAAHHWQQVLASAALRVFPNTTLTAAVDHVRAPGPVGPATVRRALAHAEAHAHEPVEVGDLAVAAGIGVRALQLAYAQHVGCTPMAHLRRVRLGRAHAELVAAIPRAADGSGTTVAAVAARWGFSPKAFAAAYRSQYGCSPSDTLRS